MQKYMADERNPLTFIYYRVEFNYFEAIRKHSISPAPRKIRGRSAEDPRKTPAEVRGRRAPGGHPVKESSISQSGAGGHRVRLSISHSTCTAEDPRKIRGRSAEDPCGSRGSRSTPGHRLPNFGDRPPRKIRGRHRGSHLAPPAPF